MTIFSIFSLTTFSLSSFIPSFPLVRKRKLISGQVVENNLFKTTFEICKFIPVGMRLYKNRA